jgi:hypothetical protein
MANIAIDTLIDDVARRAAVDPDFRKIAVSNPKQALETFYGQPLDVDVPIHFADNSGSSKTFVLPPLMANSGELSEADLEHVAGGTDWCICTNGCCVTSLTIL